MHIKSFLAAMAAAVTLLAATQTGAAPIIPAYSTFGTLPGATFGGSGIPNTAVAIAESQGDLTIGLTAHQRFVGPNLANDGAGTFTAFVGNSNTASDPFATWNFAFYIAGGDISDTRFLLLYDFDPAADTDASAHGSVGASGQSLGNPTQNSWNLGMDFLTVAGGGITPPAGTFDPTVPGEYTFALIAIGFDQGQDVEVARAAIRVNVLQQAVPEPGTLLLAAPLLIGLAALRRRR